MENVSAFCQDNEEMELPPGFRFHPTDEELISHYLSPKVLDNCFCARAIGEVDLNSCEPWDLPRKAKMGEKEWYFFCVRDRKYPTGLRTNRATEAGYWKATGKDKEIYKMKTLVGMKKTLVFYKGRAPKGEKTNWVMHEYRMEGKYPFQNLPKTSKNEWVICRIFEKTSGGKKTHVSGLIRMIADEEDELVSFDLPPLMDYSRVSCFSNSVQEKKTQQNLFNIPINPLLVCSSSSSSNPTYVSPHQNSFYPTQIFQNSANHQYPETGFMQDQSILKMLLENNGLDMKKNSREELSQDTSLSTDINTDNSSVLSKQETVQRSYEDNEFLSNCGGLADLECLWNY